MEPSSSVYGPACMLSTHINYTSAAPPVSLHSLSFLQIRSVDLHIMFVLNTFKNINYQCTGKNFCVSQETQKNIIAGNITQVNVMFTPHHIKHQEVLVGSRAKNLHMELL